MARYYLAGPMTGYEGKNFEAFHAAARQLRAAGHTVWSPAEPDPSIGFDPLMNFNETMSYYMAYELPEVCRADAVVVMSGWENSRGANIEVHVARACGKPILDVNNLQPITTPNKWGL